MLSFGGGFGVGVFDATQIKEGDGSYGIIIAWNQEENGVLLLKINLFFSQQIFSEWCISGESENIRPWIQIQKCKHYGNKKEMEHSIHCNTSNIPKSPATGLVFRRKLHKGKLFRAA